jgi:hypothetical protein
VHISQWRSHVSRNKHEVTLVYDGRGTITMNLITSGSITIGTKDSSAYDSNSGRTLVCRDAQKGISVARISVNTISGAVDVIGSLTVNEKPIVSTTISQPPVIIMSTTYRCIDDRGKNLWYVDYRFSSDYPDKHKQLDTTDMLRLVQSR